MDEIVSGESMSHGTVRHRVYASHRITRVRAFGRIRTVHDEFASSRSRGKRRHYGTRRHGKTLKVQGLCVVPNVMITEKATHRRVKQ